MKTKTKEITTKLVRLKVETYNRIQALVNGFETVDETIARITSFMENGGKKK
jgi:hypothetical protein